MKRPIYFYSKLDDYYELSNFAPFGFEEDGVYWPTVEHYFQAQKFSDSAYRERIRNAGSPKQAKALGRSRKLPIRENWDEVREDVMLHALRLKFAHPKPRSVLLGTRQRTLVERSPYDAYWGCGRNGKGTNRLGELLMQLRGELRGGAQ